MSDMDDWRELLYFLIVLLFFDPSLPGSAPTSPACDEARIDHLHEGNIGEVEHFPWLGLLRVHLHEYGELKIAVTGLVLVKSAYAIANADDVSKIPKILFAHDSKAMFIPKRGEPWFAKPKDYMVHPEYEFSTYNTIALVELDVEERGQVPFKPVCWPGQFFNTSNQLYALGFTDENKLMEKTIYTLQFVKPSLCEEFYNRVGFSEPRTAPTYFHCGFPVNNKNDCVWENGMALASNASGVWTLIGFGLRGPGCSAPARFIDMSEYFPWVESATDLEQVSDYRRKTALGVGFRRSGKETGQLSEPETTKDTKLFREQYPRVDKGFPRKYKVYQLDPRSNMFWIYPPHSEEAQFIKEGDIDLEQNQTEAEIPSSPCKAPKVLVYREKLKLVDRYENEGTLEYRVTMYDKTFLNYTCLKLKLGEVLSKFPVKFWLINKIERYEGESFQHDAAGDTPHKLFKKYPLPPARQKDSANEDRWKPGKHMEAKFLVDDHDYTGFETLNIILGFQFWAEASMDLSVYGYPRLSTPKTTTPEPEKDRRRNLMKEASFPLDVTRRKRRGRMEKARERIAERRARLYMMSAHGYL